MPLSRKAINRAGRILADQDGTGEQEGWALDAAQEWRRIHIDPLLWLSQSAQRRVRRLGQPFWFAGRLKRMPQIVRKLKREQNMMLGRMQDLGGCRFVLPDETSVNAAADRITRRSQPWYEIVRVVDYRDCPRDTGYRAVHLICRRNGLLIEVQLRTQRQHAWAEAVERASDRTGFRLKDGEGPEELLGFFRAASDAFHDLECGRSIDSSRPQLLRSYAMARRHLPPPPATTSTDRAKSVRDPTGAGLGIYLIVYDWKNAKFLYWMLIDDAAEATTRYGTWENEYRPEDGYEVVLIAAHSSGELRRTHSHYFGREPNDLDPFGRFQDLFPRS